MSRIVARLLIAWYVLAFVAGCQEKKAPLQTQTTRPTSAAAAIEPEEPPATPAQREEALKRLDQAMKAHGGENAMKKLGVCIQKVKGSMRMQQLGMMPAEQELKLQFPSELRLTTKISVQNEAKEILLGLNAEGGWYGTAGQIKDMSDSEVAEHRAEMHLRRAYSLFPLRDSQFNLKPIDGVEVDGKPTFGIRVAHKLWPSVDLYFDSKTSLLVRCVCKFSLAGVVFRRETNFSDFKTIDGLVLPTRIVEWLDSDKILDTSVAYSFPAKIDAKEFQKP